MQTPVAFLIYRRPELTRRVFAEIARARPPRLLVVADGPRADSERAACDAARAVIAAVDWPCHVDTHFADANLGCRRCVSGGLDWVFSRVEEAIILEDDCLPHPTFFPFCEDLLERYRHDPRVGHIGGTDVNEGPPRGTASYYFSRYTSIWGWATWRRSWQHYDVTLEDWPAMRAAQRHHEFFTTPEAADFAAGELDAIHAGTLDTWDWQWQVCCLRQNALCVVPNGNLVSNLGFHADATHTRDADHPLAGLPVRPMAFPLRHPAAIAADTEADQRRGAQGAFVRRANRLQGLAAAVRNKHRYGKLLRALPLLGPVWARWRSRGRS
ncbi:MAG: glycosyltransferase family 2 protein [Lentisphaerae bacterium]|nr:glycosyltransferase family 2 protein [Lentisphaerota bacterium]